MTAPGNPGSNCPVCAGQCGREVVEVREMMFGSRESFTYVVCENCGSLFLHSVPDSLAGFYPSDYYSFNVEERSKIRQALKAAWLRAGMGRPTLLGRMLNLVMGPPYLPVLLRDLDLAESARILDVGCGRGAFLHDLELAGFRNLVGVDPFLDADQVHGRVTLLKRRIEDLDGEFDLIMSHHSLEHIADPFAALGHMHRLLRPKGHALIRIPLAQSFPHREYGTNWVEWDAPRHLVIPSARGMGLLAQRAGFEVFRTVYDGNGFELWGSEAYKRGIPLRECRAHPCFSSAEFKAFARQARQLNEQGQGGRAAFFLRKDRSRDDE